MYDFIDDRQHVRDAEVLAEVRKPTVRTVLTCVRLFAAEILAARSTLADRALELDFNDGTAADAVAYILATRPAEAARVLATCCRCHARDGAALCEGAAAELLAERPALLKAVARAALGLCDLRRIVDSLDLAGLDALGVGEDAAATDAGDDAPGDAEIALVSIAVRIGVDPFVIAEWPFEGWLSVLDVMPLLRPGAEGGAASRGRLEPLTAANAPIGIGVHQAATPQE